MTVEEAFNRLEYTSEIVGEDYYATIDDVRAIEVARSCVEKQIPKKVMKGGVIRCPKCDAPILLDWAEYCVKCGQKIDWE